MHMLEKWQTSRIEEGKPTLEKSMRRRFQKLERWKARSTSFRWKLPRLYQGYSIQNAKEVGPPSIAAERIC